MRSPQSLTVVSLGSGVQPSVMAFMADEGAFDRNPGLRRPSPTLTRSRPASTPT